MGVKHWVRCGLLVAAAVAAPCWAAQGSGEGAAESAPQYRLIGENDTLWGIAVETAPSSRIGVIRYMLAIQLMNPDAFLDGDLDRLMVGYRLRLPSEAEVLTLTAPREQMDSAPAEPPPAEAEAPDASVRGAAQASAVPEGLEAQPVSAEEETQAADSGLKTAAGDRGTEEQANIPDDPQSEGSVALPGQFQPSAGELDAPLAAADGNAGIEEAAPDEPVAVEERYLAQNEENGLTEQRPAAADAPDAASDFPQQQAEAFDAQLGLAADGEAGESEMAFAPETGAILDLARTLARSGAEQLDGLQRLWLRDPGTSRTVAIMAAFLIGGLILARRRRKPGAARTSGRASGRPRAGRSFAPLPAPGIDLDFPEAPDPAGLKLQLAEAYFDLGDGEGVRYLLEEVLAEGSPEQCRRAEALAERLA